MSYLFTFILCLNVFFSGLFPKDSPIQIKDFVTKLNEVKNDTEDLSVALITLFVLKYQTLDIFQKNNLQSELEKIIKKLPKNISLANIFDVHSAVDFWYFSKQLGYKDEYKVSEKELSEFLNPSDLETITDPGEALLYWIIITSLLYCDNQTYKHLESFLPSLEKQCQKNNHVYAYLLTHIILYECIFGKNKPLHNSEIALQKLEGHTKKLKFEQKNIDILAEAVWCAKLCNKEKKGQFKKLEKKLHSLSSFTYFHEQCMVLLATLPFK